VPFSSSGSSFDPYSYASRLGATARRFYDSWFDRVNALERRQVWSNMAKKKKNNTRSSSARNGRRGNPASTSRGLGGMSPTAAGDLMIRPPDILSIPRSVPRNVAGLVSWDVVKVSQVITTSATTTTETNFSVSLGSHPQATSWQLLYDQWFIPQFTVQFESLMPPGSLTAPSVLYTALDFDNTANINTVVAIGDFSSCATRVMNPQTSFMRSVRPCSKVPTSAGLIRQWCDTSTPNTNFFGIRSILDPSGAAYNILVVLTIWFAFRNQI